MKSIRLITTTLVLFIISGIGIAYNEIGDRRIISSNEILSRIENSESIEISSSMIDGDLIFDERSSAKPKTINSDIKIYNSIIIGKWSFNNTIFNKPINIEKTKFLGPAYFAHTQFMDGISLKDSEFNDVALFWGAQFYNSSNFRKVKFHGPVDFWKSKFKSELIDFEASQFNKSAVFRGVDFQADITSFSWSNFNESANFWSARFGKMALFQGVYFKDTVDLTMAKFNETADFEGVRFDKEVYFNDVRFTSFMVNWASLEDRLTCNGPAYLCLIKSFKDLEQFEDADACYYQYRDWKRELRSPGWPKLFDYIAWVSCGYGVRWQYTIISGILMIALFGIYFESSYLARTTANVFLKRSAQNSSISNLWRSIKKSISFSAMILLSLPSDWFPYGKEEYSKLVKSHLYAAILERLIGWGLMLLLIGTLTRLMVRY